MLIRVFLHAEFISAMKTVRIILVISMQKICFLDGKEDKYSL